MSQKKTISLIALMDINRVVSVNGDQPWYFKWDLKRFKERTMGHSVIVGRKTYEAISRKTSGGLLPGRDLIVLTRGNAEALGAKCVFAHTLDAAIDRANGSEVFVAGGADIYAQAMPLADKLYLTIVKNAARLGSDTLYFPEIGKEWECKCVGGSSGLMTEDSWWWYECTRSIRIVQQKSPA